MPLAFIHFFEPHPSGPVDPGWGVSPPVDPGYGRPGWRPVDPGYGNRPPVDPGYGRPSWGPVDPSWGVRPPVDPGYGRPGWGPVDPGWGYRPPVDPGYGRPVLPGPPSWGGGWGVGPFPTHPIYYPDKPVPPGEAPPDAAGLPPIVVWVPGIGWIEATPGVPPKPVPEPTPPEAQPKR